MRAASLGKLAAVLAATVIFAAPAVLSAQEDLGAARAAPRGSIARQLQVKAKLLAAAQRTTLVAMLDHNRAEWESLSAEQREGFRRESRAFRAKDPKRQEEMIRRFDEWIRLAGQRKQKYRLMYRWVKVVAASFTPEQREKIRRMSADQRARAYRTRRDELVEAGELKLDQPASAPAPTTQPAD